MPPKKSTCPICCREKPNHAMWQPNACNHKTCRSCIKQWIRRVEASCQSLDLPGCPYCRVRMNEKEIAQVLGRPYNPLRHTTNRRRAAETEGVDDLTRQWLQERTRACPRCGNRIEKVEGGCDLMECLCGCRFCFSCGSVGAYCYCTPSNHVYFDNYNNRPAERVQPPQVEVSDDGGVVDLATHITKRLRQEQAKAKRTERAKQREVLRQEVVADEESCYYVSRWLFSGKGGNFRVLEQLLLREKVKQERATRREQENVEQEEMGAFGFSIFEKHNKAISKEAEEVRKKRAKKRKDNAMELEREHGRVLVGVDAALSVWLFKKKSPDATRKHLSRLYDHYTRWNRIYFDRVYEKLVVQGVAETEDAKVNALNIRTLFLEEASAKKRERGRMERLQLGCTDLPAHTTEELDNEQWDRIAKRMRQRYGDDWVRKGNDIILYVN